MIQLFTLQGRIVRTAPNECSLKNPQILQNVVKSSAGVWHTSHFDISVCPFLLLPGCWLLFCMLLHLNCVASKSSWWQFGNGTPA